MFPYNLSGIISAKAWPSLGEETLWKLCKSSLHMSTRIVLRTINNAGTLILCTPTMVYWRVSWCLSISIDSSVLFLLLVCRKDVVWFLKCSLQFVASLMYDSCLLVCLLVMSTWYMYMYTMFVSRHFPWRGHSSFVRQLYCLLGCCIGVVL